VKKSTFHELAQCSGSLIQQIAKHSKIGTVKTSSRINIPQVPNIRHDTFSPSDLLVKQKNHLNFKYRKYEKAKRTRILLVHHQILIQSASEEPEKHTYSKNAKSDLARISSAHHIVRTSLLKKGRLLPLENISTTYHPHFTSCRPHLWKSGTPTIATTCTSLQLNLKYAIVRINLGMSTGQGFHMKTYRNCAGGPWESWMEIRRYLQIMVSKNLIISMARVDKPIRWKIYTRIRKWRQLSRKHFRYWPRSRVGTR